MVKPYSTHCMSVSIKTLLQKVQDQSLHESGKKTAKHGLFGCLIEYGKKAAKQNYTKSCSWDGEADHQKKVIC